MENTVHPFLIDKVLHDYQNVLCNLLYVFHLEISSFFQSLLFLFLDE